MPEPMMHIENRSLVLDLVEWVAGTPRPYAEVLDAWRTSCPRLTIWEDAVDHGFVVCDRRDGQGIWVTATPAGIRFLHSAGRAAAATGTARA